MKCKNCQKEFSPNPKRKANVYCSNVCANRAKCQRYHKRYLAKERKRKLSWYHETRKTQEGIDRIRAINYKANTKRRFGVSNRKELLSKIGNKCYFCGRIKKNSVIHHLDKVGRNVDNPNNELSNLAICCRECHAKIHLLGQEL